jgi:peptidoglycan/xylan/chitin deacetylase (PgdA/CDA1 family)
MSFDDGNESIYTNAFSYMESIGLHKATIYVNPAVVGNAGKCTWEQLAEMYTAGWDIANHTQNHTDLRPLTQAQAEAEFSLAQAALDAHGFTRSSRHIAYPYGYYTDASDAAMITTGMLTGRLTTGDEFDYTTANPHRLPTYSGTFSLGTTIATIQARILSAKIHKMTAQLVGHQIIETPTTTTEYSIADFQAVMDWVKAEGIELITINDLYERM